MSLILPFNLPNAIIEPKNETVPITKPTRIVSNVSLGFEGVVVTDSIIVLNNWVIEPPMSWDDC